MNQLELDLAFSEAMENCGTELPKEVTEKRKILCDALEDYLDALERHSFQWGYSECLKKINSLVKP